MLILLLLLFIGVELNADFLYWIIWGVAFTIESINLLGCIQFDSNDEEDNKKWEKILLRRPVKGS